MEYTSRFQTKTTKKDLMLEGEFREVRGGNYGANNPIWSLINRGVAEV